MSSVEQRRRAWAALGLGPLWRPVAGALPHAPIPVAESGPPMAMQGPDAASDDGSFGDDPDSALPDEAWQAMAADAAAFAPMDEADPDFDAPTEHPADALLSAKSGLSEPERWQQLRQAVSDCRRCALADSRKNTVFGRGQAGRVRWMLIGEAPGAEEDRRGEAFVGQAGQLLDAMLRAAGIDPTADVFIANVLKCRPPNNRNPEQEEVVKCEPFLHEQIRLAAPECILLLGRFAAQSVLNSTLPISRLRNKVHHIALAGRQVPVICTFHPAYLLRNPLDKLRSWEDLCLARSVLGEQARP